MGIWNNVFIVIVLFVSGFGVAAADQQRALTDQQWREDLEQLSTAIKEIHFKPFHNVSEDDFDKSVESLSASIPSLSDSEIIVSMAKIVAQLQDGHTRIHLPRKYPEFALEAELGHGGTPPPKVEALKFDQLPVAFDLFEDGLFITAATAEYKHLTGRQVSKVGNLDSTEAIERLKAVSFHENQSRAKLIVPDRLALPEVLKAMDMVDSADEISITTVANDSEEHTILKPMTGPADSRINAGDHSVLWLSNRKAHQWYQVLPEQDAIYVQVNQFAENPTRIYGAFVAETLAAARKAGVSRYVIDLRHNSGGIGAWTIPFLTGLSRSEFNQYGRLYILMGRTTFSAAQHFLHEFEEYTYAMFVGEPSGAKPSHYGDGRRVVLNHSGLSMRVSTIYWHSWLANDFRESSIPHIDAPQTSADYFEGRDPGLEAALSYTAPQTIALQIDEQLRKEKNQNGLLLLQRYITDGTISDHAKAVPGLLDVGHGLLDDEITRPGFFVLFLTNRYFPGNPEVLAGLGRAHELMDAKDDAVAAYQVALEIDAENTEAREGLARLSGD